MKNLKLFTIIVLIIFLQSCRSKQKAVEREKKIEEIEAVVNSEEKILEEITVDRLEVSKSEIKEIRENTTEEIEADSTGTVTVEVVKTDTGYIKTYKGVSKVKVTKDTRETNKTDTTALKLEINAEKELTKKDESFIKIKNESKTRKTDVEIKSTSTWFWLILALLLALFLYLNRKRILRLF